MGWGGRKASLAAMRPGNGGQQKRQHSSLKLHEGVVVNSWTWSGMRHDLPEPVHGGLEGVVVHYEEIRILLLFCSGFCMRGN